MSKKKRHYKSGKEGASANMALGESGYANLPSETVMRLYPAVDADNWYSDFDTPAGVDRQMADDCMGAKRQKKHRKY